MKFRDFFRSGPAGIAAGVATVMLGGGAVAALAFSSPEPARRPMGDSRLSVGNQAFDAALVANAGANNVAGARAAAARDMADGSPVARTSAVSAPSAGGVANGSSATQSRGTSSASSATVPTRPGSAEYYRALLSAGSGGGGSLAMLPPGAIGRISSGGRLAGDLTGANATDYTRDPAANAVGDPLVPSRAFSSYGTNDAGSSATSSNAARKPTSTRPAMGTSAVGPAAAKPSSNPGASSGSSALPAASAPAPVVPTMPAKRSDPSPGASSVPGMVSSASSNTVTQPLGPGQTSIPGSIGNAVNQPATPPPGTPGTNGGSSTTGTPVPPPVTSVVSPAAILTPEPGTWMMVGSGLLLLGIMGRRRANRTG